MRRFEIMNAHKTERRSRASSFYLPALASILAWPSGWSLRLGRFQARMRPHSLPLTCGPNAIAAPHDSMFLGNALMTQWGACNDPFRIMQGVQRQRLAHVGLDV